MRKLEAALGNKVAVRHKPHGVLAVLGPYNFPAHLPNGHIVPALIAGNAVVFKPSEKTPAIGRDAGRMPPRRGHSRRRRAAADRRARRGPRAGRRSRASTACCSPARRAPAWRSTASSPTTPHKILALELGGNNPIVVWDATDIDAAAAIVVQSAYLSAGQRCTAARRLIVEDGAEGPLVEAIVKLIDRIIVDHPHADPQPFMGPVIDHAAADHLQDRNRSS